MPSAAENARLVRCLTAWLAERPECSCDFPDEEIGESGIIYCDPCSLRDFVGLDPSEAHARRFGRAAARGEVKP